MHVAHHIGHGAGLGGMVGDQHGGLAGAAQDVAHLGGKVLTYGAPSSSDPRTHIAQAKFRTGRR